MKTDFLNENGFSKFCAFSANFDLDFENRVWWNYTFNSFIPIRQMR
jgi:hypothetical protein